MHVPEFRSEDSGTCHRISHDDDAVRDEPACTIVSVVLARRPGNEVRGGRPAVDLRNRLRSVLGEG